MRKIISFMHVSLDGFVAGPNGEMDWIQATPELFEHVSKRINTGDTALYGRKTFQMMEAYWPTAAENPGATKHDISHSLWYKQIHKIVLSTTRNSSDFANTTIIRENLREHLEKIKSENGTDILLFGSPTATHALMELDVIDGYWLFVNPIILGEGIPLFDGIKHKTALKLIQSNPVSTGVIELDYEVDRS